MTALVENPRIHSAGLDDRKIEDLRVLSHKENALENILPAMRHIILLI